MVGPKEVKGDVRFIADHPAIVRNRWNMKKVTSLHLDDPAVVKGSHCGACEHHPDMFNLAA